MVDFLKKFNPGLDKLKNALTAVGNNYTTASRSLNYPIHTHENGRVRLVTKEERRMMRGSRSSSSNYMPMSNSTSNRMPMSISTSSSKTGLEANPTMSFRSLPPNAKIEIKGEIATVTLPNGKVIKGEVVTSREEAFEEAKELHSTLVLVTPKGYIVTF